MSISPEQLDDLAHMAREASSRSYCPYSGFAVGASLLTQDQKVFQGCNVENSSYGLTICAERSAIFNAIAACGPSIRIVALVVYTPTAEPAPSCGACRQVISEFGADAEVVSVCDGPTVLRHSLRELLPSCFDQKCFHERGKEVSGVC